MVRPERTEVAASSSERAPSSPGLASPSRRLRSSQRGCRSFGRGAMRTSSQPPLSRSPRMTKLSFPPDSASAGSSISSAGSQVPWSQTITVPAP